MSVRRIADLQRRAPARSRPAPVHAFPWLETVGFGALVAAAGVGATTARRRRSAPA